MIRLLFVFLVWPAFAGQVRWATRLSADVRDTVERLRECGVDGRVLRWRNFGTWSPHLLVTRLPARAGACRAPWLFLHDAEMLARLREFMVTHEGLLLNLRGLGPQGLVRAAGERGFSRLHDLEPAIGDAALLLRPEDDLYELIGALKSFDDVVHGFARKADERFYSLSLPKLLLEPTVKFVREARILAAEAHALESGKRTVEFRIQSGAVKALDDDIVAHVYRDLRLRELRSHFKRLTVPEFTRAYRVVHEALPPEVGETYDIYLLDALRPEDYRVLDLASLVPRCASELNEPKAEP